jgi:hypothetical protein
MLEWQRKVIEDAKKVPPAVYTAAEYDIVITVVKGYARYGKVYRALFLPTENGEPMTYRGGVRGMVQTPVKPQRSLEDARWWARLVLFRRWDEDRVKALGGNASRNASQQEWEKLQTFRETIVFPKPSIQKKLRRALTARKKAEEAVRQAAAATKEAVEALCGIGMYYSDVGGLLGVSKMRVCQILGKAADKAAGPDES